MMSFYVELMNCGSVVRRLPKIGAVALALLALAFLLTACLPQPRPDEAMAKVVIRPKHTATEAAIPAAPLKPTATPPKPTAAPAPTAAPVALPAAQAGLALKIGTAGEDWLFSPAAIESSAGETVALTFTNNAAVQRHHWVLVRGGDDVAADVNAAGAEAGEAAGYLVADPRLVAHTVGLVGGGASATLIFTPEAGTYTFLCTVPGHYDTGMSGTLTVQ